MAEAQALQEQLLSLADEDARVFKSLSEVWKLPRSTVDEKEHRAARMESALRACCDVPLQVMDACCKAIDVLEGFALLGAEIVISDAGVGAALARAALQGASLNVFVNTRAMKDRGFASEANRRAHAMLDSHAGKAEAAFSAVSRRLEP
jgi:formiminotetrahydrofolate cyclodeaminase